MLYLRNVHELIVSRRLSHFCHLVSRQIQTEIVDLVELEELYNTTHLDLYNRHLIDEWIGIISPKM
jgi:hypothetical protein